MVRASARPNVGARLGIRNSSDAGPERGPPRDRAVSSRVRLRSKDPGLGEEVPVEPRVPGDLRVEGEPP